MIMSAQMIFDFHSVYIRNAYIQSALLIIVLIFVVLGLYFKILGAIQNKKNLKESEAARRKIMQQGEKITVKSDSLKITSKKS